MRNCACKKTRRAKKITRKQGQFNLSLKGDQMKGRRDPACPSYTSCPVQFTSLLQLGPQPKKDWPRQGKTI